MSTRRFLVTSALPYSNGRLHVGHVAGAYLPADIYVRYLRSRGADVRFVCGTDDHGVAPLIAARKEGTPVAEMTARFHAQQRRDFERLGISFDVYGGTHQPGFADLHRRFSQEFFRKIHDGGFFLKKKSLQLYDEQAAQFLPDRFVKGGCYHTKSDGAPCNHPDAHGDQCEACGNLIDPAQLRNPVSALTGSRPVLRETTHWYLRLQAFEGALREWLESKRRPPEGAAPWRDFVLNFALGQIRQGLPERAMTRDLDWGVPVPLDDPDAASKVLYVWFDAPIGYVSFTAALCQARDGDWRDYARWWKNPDCRIVHFIGEDNIVFHALTWPAMLLAEGSYQLPWQVVANAYLNIQFPGEEEQKISKSRGAAVWIEDYLRECPADPLRYYLTAIAPESRRTAFRFDDLVRRNDGELGNALGNFVHRTIAFAHRYFEGRVPPAGRRDEADRAHLDRIAVAARKTAELIEEFHFKAALGEVMALARAANGYLDEKAPWRKRKDSPPACAATINVCVQTVKALAALMAPFLPFSAAACAEMLNLEERPPAWDSATEELPPGHPLGEPKVLFQRWETRPSRAAPEE
jgi:methionyl-tRNA synthetase